MRRCRRSSSGVPCLVLFHPDYTVGSGISPDLLTLPLEKALAGSGIASDTAGGEFHPALRTMED